MMSFYMSSMDIGIVAIKGNEWWPFPWALGLFLLLLRRNSDEPAGFGPSAIVRPSASS